MLDHKTTQSIEQVTLGYAKKDGENWYSVSFDGNEVPDFHISETSFELAGYPGVNLVFKPEHYSTFQVQIAYESNNYRKMHKKPLRRGKDKPKNSNEYILNIFGMKDLYENKNGCRRKTRRLRRRWKQIGKILSEQRNNKSE